ncbi:salicylic acid-binding protein 2-like [Musa acuminata AAA Group]|uniref:salicylic acid-binding protein 2-like n=1 Tax=Musa acuminata AAA Group TaxID=214697 RepID=UPI0031D1D40E
MEDERVKEGALRTLGLFQVLPRLVVFDLDYTLWPFYCIIHICLDTQFGLVVGDRERGPTSMLFGPKFLSKLYKLSPPEDLTLAMTLARPSSLFLEDLVSMPPFSESGYGSVEKVYVVCAQDEGISEGFQRWMIKNDPVKVVKEMEDADHMAGHVLNTETALPMPL